MGNQIAGLHAGSERGRLIDGRNNLDVTAFHRDFDTEAAKFAFRLHLHIAEVFTVQERRVRVEIGKHSANSGFNQFFIGDFFDIIRSDPFENIAKKFQQSIGFGPVLLFRRHRT